MSQPNQVTLQLEDESPAEPTPRNPVVLRLDSITRPAVSRNNMGIGDRLNSVFREIRPLVEHARMNNNARLSLPTWLPRNQTQQAADATLHRQSSIAHVNLGPTAQTFIITDRVSPVNQTQSGVSNTTSDNNLSDQADGNTEASVNPSSNNNINDNADNDAQSEDGAQQIVDIRATLLVLIKYAPFYLILFIKFLYDCREGLITFLILFSTFTHSNTLVRREHGKQMSRSIPTLFFELVFTVGCVYIVHFLFGHDKLLPNVVMFPPYDGTSMDVWELLWLIGLTDLIVKIITVDLKILVTMMPAGLLPFQKRGKVYLFLESVSQLYRSLLTIQPWMYFLMYAYKDSEKFVGMILTSVYVIAKIVEVLMRLRFFKNATWTLLQSVNLGTKPTREQLEAAGATCPVCHDVWALPVRLACSHIYCELCIAAWLDRDHTCPLCRARVADEPCWRDGSTTYQMQLY